MNRYQCRCGASPYEDFWGHHELSDRHKDFLNNQVEKEKEVLNEVSEGENLEVKVVRSDSTQCPCGGRYKVYNKRHHSRTRIHRLYVLEQQRSEE